MTPRVCPQTCPRPQFGPQAQYIYVDEYLWTLRHHKSCFLAPRVEMRILIFSDMIWVHHVLSSASISAFLTAQGMLLTLRSLECAFIKFLLLFVPYVLCCDVDRTAKNPVGMGAGIFPLVSFFL